MDASVWFMYLDRHSTAVKYIRCGQQQEVATYVRGQAVSIVFHRSPLCLIGTLGPGMDASVWFMYLDRRSTAAKNQFIMITYARRLQPTSGGKVFL